MPLPWGESDTKTNKTQRTSTSVQKNLGRRRRGTSACPTQTLRCCRLRVPAPERFIPTRAEPPALRLLKGRLGKQRQACPQTPVTVLGATAAAGRWPPAPPPAGPPGGRGLASPPGPGAGDAPPPQRPQGARWIRCREGPPGTAAAP